MELGKDVPEDDLIGRIRGQAPNKCCTLIYTVRRCCHLMLFVEFDKDIESNKSLSRMGITFVLLLVHERLFFLSPVRHNRTVQRRHVKSRQREY